MSWITSPEEDRIAEMLADIAIKDERIDFLEGQRSVERAANGETERNYVKLQADNARLREALEAIIAMDDHDEQADRVADAIEEIKRDWLQ